MTLPEGTYTTEEITVFKQYFDAYYGSIRGFLYYKSRSNDLADDIVQEVFIKLWEMRENVNPETVRPLLYTISLNLLRNHYKHEKIVYNFAKKQPTVDRGTEPADFQIQQNEFNRKLEQVLASIPENSRVVFLMSRMEGLSYTEIAERLGLSVKAIEKRMHEALLIIKKKLNYKI